MNRYAIIEISKNKINVEFTNDDKNDKFNFPEAKRRREEEMQRERPS